MTDPLVSCLCVTHGRHRHLSFALACFLQQSYPNRELLILNHHLQPLVCEHPRVRVINAPSQLTYGANLNLLLDEAQGELVRTWDDDDIYLPHSIVQGVAFIGQGFAWKPRPAWFYDGRVGEPVLLDNNCEPSVTWRTSFVRAVGYDPGHHEHHLLHLAAENAGGIPSHDVGYLASFLHTWGTGLFHLSGSLGSDKTPEERASAWRAANQDHGRGKPLMPGPTYGWFALLRKYIPTSILETWKEAVGAEYL